MKFAVDLSVDFLAFVQRDRTWWTFQIFFIFFAWGRGSRGARGGGLAFFTENPRRGGVSRRGRGRGAGRVSASNWGIWGGGLNIFFRGRNVHQEKAPRNPQKKFTQKSMTKSTLSEWKFLTTNALQKGNPDFSLALICHLLATLESRDLVKNLELPTGKHWTDPTWRGPDKVALVTSTAKALSLAL